jgi:hypothetical protein
MYELTKQKSTGFRIVFGIIIFAFITAVLKMALPQRTSTLNDDLIKSANEINLHAPIIIDSATRLDNVNALSGNVFQYNYTLLTLDRTQIDTNLVKTSGKQLMIHQMKQDPKVAFFKENNIEIRLKYTDKNGVEITTIFIYPSEY